MFRKLYFKYQSDNDPVASSEAKSLANNELGDFEFLVAIVIWYEILYAVNVVSKDLQLKDMLIDVAIEKVQDLISFFKQYRETGFLNALEATKELHLRWILVQHFKKRGKLKEREILMRIQMTQILRYNLQRNHFESTTLFL
jgi:hypothetical protein